MDETRHEPTSSPAYASANGVFAAVESRRKRGRTTFTWMRFYRAGGESYSGAIDPWPCMNPKKSEVAEECLRLSAIPWTTRQGDSTT